MIVYLTGFSERGMRLAKRVAQLPLAVSYGCFFSRYGGRLADDVCMPVYRGKEPLHAWLEAAFADGFPVIIVGALGIAVRAIAPFLKHKTADSPVLVLDEAGQFVIPVVSGHLGGANELAAQIADGIGAVPVITTATDVNGQFAIDVFARRLGLRVCDPTGIKRVSGKVLRGLPVTVAVDGSVVEPAIVKEHLRDAGCLLSWAQFRQTRTADVVIAREIPAWADAEAVLLHLAPRPLVLGMGCRKGKDAGAIEQALKEAQARGQLSLEEIGMLSSITQKEWEPGLRRLAQKLRVPFVVFTPEELKRVPGEFAPSAFVEKTVGVDNVCERAAAAAADGGTLLIKKQAVSGMTYAIAQKTSQTGGMQQYET